MTDYGKSFKSSCDQLFAIGKSVEKGDKSHWFVRGLRLNLVNFTDTNMEMTLVPSFRDLLHQAIQFNLINKAMEGSTPSHTAFVTLGNNDGKACNSGQQTGNGRGGQ